MSGRFRRAWRNQAAGEESLGFWCPGCEDWHYVPVSGAVGSTWRFDGNWDSPTLHPSILLEAATTTEGRELTPRCHSWLVSGSLRFEPDCGHVLAGRTVEVPEPPEEEGGETA